MSRDAYVYLDFVPRSYGSGADLRCHSNIRALQDLGYAVHLLVLREERDTNEPDFPVRSISHVDLPRDEGGLLGRIGYRVSVGTSAAFRYAFPGHSRILQELRGSLERHPDALHFIEGERNASVLPFLQAGRIVWSHHDSLWQTTTATARIACDLEGRALSVPERRAIRFAKRAEDMMLRSAPLVLTISDADRIRLRESGYTNVDWLPMSVPDERAYRLQAGKWLADGTVTLLHLGRTAHLPSFRSLEFLLRDVLPCLPDDTRSRIRLLIAGENQGRDARSVRIRELARSWPDQVELLGFVQDLHSLVARADLQVVGSSDAAGLRTRIIESFACGLPVLSTAVGASGIVGLEHGENILLCNSTDEFASALRRVLEEPGRLGSLAAKGRALYEKQYSRAVVAATLERQLHTRR